MVVLPLLFFSASHGESASPTLLKTKAETFSSVGCTRRVVVGARRGDGAKRADKALMGEHELAAGMNRQIAGQLAAAAAVSH